MKTLLDVSDDGSKIFYEEIEGKIVLTTEHPDTTELEKHCAEQRALSKGKFEKKGAFHHVLKPPKWLLTKICAEHNLNFFDSEDAKKILKILKRPEYAKFRTYDGNI